MARQGSLRQLIEATTASSRAHFYMPTSSRHDTYFLAATSSIRPPHAALQPIIPDYFSPPLSSFTTAIARVHDAGDAARHDTSVISLLPCHDIIYIS